MGGESSLLPKSQDNIRAEGTSSRRIFAIEMLGYALVSRVAMVIAGWYFSWAVTPNWPDFLTGSKIFFPWAQWDGYHYARIAHHGYGDVGDPGISAFFPLYPLIMHIVGLLFGAESMVDYQITGVVVGWLLFLISTYVCASMFRDYFDEPLARTMTLLWLFSPFAFFLSTAYTEGLFFIAVALCFILLHKKKILVGCSRSRFRIRYQAHGRRACVAYYHRGLA